MTSLLPRRLRKKAPSDAETHGSHDAPSSPPKTRNSTRNAIPEAGIHTAELSSLLQEMDELVALDRILDARDVVHRIREAEAKIGFAPHGLISPDSCARMDEIMSEANRIDHLLSDLRSDDTWHLVKSRGGVTVHYRNEEGSPIHSVKTHAIIENVDAIGFVRICSLFLESDLFPLWAPHNVIESSDILVSPSKFRQVLHMKMSFGRFSPLSPRDAVIEGRGYHLVDDNAVLILSSSITESKFCAVPAKTRSRVRVDINAAFYIQFLPGDRVLFRQISHDDMKIRLMPAFVINFLAQGAMPAGMIQSLKAVLQRYEETEFYSRMKQKADLYAEIEDRVHKELVSNVSRMDTVDIMDSQTEPSSIDEEDDDDASTEMTSPTRLIGQGVGRPGQVVASASTNSNSMSLIATGVTCLACIFLAQFGMRLSLYWALLPRKIQLVSVACVLSLPIFMCLSSVVSNRSHGGTIRVKKRDGSIVAELSVADSPERQFMNTLTTPKKSGSRRDAVVVAEDEEMTSENKEEGPTSTTTTSEKGAPQKKKKKKPKFLRRAMMPKGKDKSKSKSM